MATPAGWRYHAYRVNGDGTETRLAADLPLSGVKFNRELSGPGGIGAIITPEQMGLRTLQGEPIFVPWSTAVYAEKDSYIRHGGLLTEPTDKGASLALDCIGFTGYAGGQPFTGDYSGIGVDPLDVVRLIWAHLQGQQGGNIGLQVDPSKSPVRIGKPVKEDSTSKDEGPFVLGWWETHDLGKVLDDLAISTPFDYLVKHDWDGETVRHTLQLGYPRIGRRRPDLRFVVGENIFTVPEITYSGEDYANEVLLLGAGEGRKMIRGLQQRPSNRLRRAVVVEDKSITDQTRADQAALNELSYRLGSADINTVSVINHPNAALGEYDVGDEIQVRTQEGWHAGLDLWVRVLAINSDPETDVQELTIQRSEKGN